MKPSRRLAILGSLTLLGTMATVASAQTAQAVISCGTLTSTVDPTVTHKGANTPSQNNGLTTFRGRVFQLRTSPVWDTSQGNIASGYKSGDKVWIDISETQGRTWVQCGPYYRDRTYFAAHGGKWMRVCVNVDGYTQCATNGNKTGPNGSKWWDD